MVTFKQYQELVEDRPVKFDEKDVNYREAEGPEHCGDCIHYFRRAIDRFAVCEIFRNKQTDEDGVKPNWVCDFFTKDAEKFPLLKDKE